MVRDAQIDPLSRRLEHVDFLRVDLDKEVQVTVPLVLTGKAIGVTNGGNLHQSLHIVPVAAKPAAIPTKLEVDVTALDIGDALHVSDLKLARGRARRCSTRARRSRRSWRRRPRRSRPRRLLPSRARCRRKARRLARPPRLAQLARRLRQAARRQRGGKEGGGEKKGK